MKTKQRWWRIYRDRSGKWRWRARASNGKVVQASEEGYSRRAYARLKAIQAGAPRCVNEVEFKA